MLHGGGSVQLAADLLQVFTPFLSDQPDALVSGLRTLLLGQTQLSATAVSPAAPETKDSGGAAAAVAVAVVEAPNPLQLAQALASLFPRFVYDPWMSGVAREDDKAAFHSLQREHRDRRTLFLSGPPIAPRTTLTLAAAAIMLLLENKLPYDVAATLSAAVCNSLLHEAFLVPLTVALAPHKANISRRVLRRFQVNRVLNSPFRLQRRAEALSGHQLET